jgi:hypothetical protein
MSEMSGMRAVLIAIDPSYSHVEATLPEPFHEPEQQFSLRAGHGSLPRTAWPQEPVGAVHVALFAPVRTESSASRLPMLIEKASSGLPEARILAPPALSPNCNRDSGKDEVTKENLQPQVFLKTL